MPQPKLLIVEDMYVLYDELCEFFEERGFAIIKNEEKTAVTSYEEAVQLMKQQKPDIAVLDIQLDSEKDGIDLGKYIRQQYGIPVVYISSKTNDKYVDRLIDNGEDQLVCRGKPLNKDQLWSAVRFAQSRQPVVVPEPTTAFLKVREVELKVDEHPTKREIKETGYLLKKEKRIEWDTIIVIHSHNKKAFLKQNNNVLLRPDFSMKAYIMPGNLKELETRLPNHFARCNKYTIANLKKVTERFRADGKLFCKVENRDFEVADIYKEKVQEKLKRLMKDTSRVITEK